ncbi:hypothetical protein [Methylorubrum aminovorans]|uniref:hypothetical protein n=1 Tax=Methylorubrum aminovorans TaxID=269069 RepID=UPI003C3035E9
MDKHPSIKHEVPQAGPNGDGNQRPDDETGEPRVVGPDVIPFSPAGRKDEDQAPATEIATSGCGLVTDLLDDAVKELRRALPKLQHSAQLREEVLRAYLARAYKLSMAGLSDTLGHKALLEKMKIKSRTNTPHHKQALRIIQRASNSPYVKGNEHEWSLVLAGMQEAAVPQTEEAVVKFLTEAAVVNGETVKGFGRAKAVLKLSRTSIKDEISEQNQSTKDDGQKSVEAAVREVRDVPLGSIELSRNRDARSGIWISVNEGDKVLIDLNLKDKELQKLISRHKSHAQNSKAMP